MIDIVEEHFEELDFLWELREGVIFAPDWNLDELAELEERAEAHLDGLRLAEMHAVEIARPALSGKHTYAATAATFVFMETADPELMSNVLAALESADEPAREGIRIGLRHSRIDAIEKRLSELVSSAPPAVRAAAADVLSFHRRALPDLRGLLADDDDAVRILAFGALGRVRTPLDSALVTMGLQSKAPTVRRSVLEAAARSTTRGLDGICRQVATSKTEPDPEALAFLGVLGDSRSFPLLQESLRRPDLEVAAIRGLGALGRSEAIPLLLQAMEKQELASIAGAAFQRITGFADITGPRPPVKLSTGDAIEDEFADDTPPPDPAKALAWWEANKRGFDPARRWQAGSEVSAGSKGPALHSLPLEIRRDVYLGTRASSVPLPDLEFECRAVLQRRG